MDGKTRTRLDTNWLKANDILTCGSPISKDSLKFLLDVFVNDMTTMREHAVKCECETKALREECNALHKEFESTLDDGQRSAYVVSEWGAPVPVNPRSREFVIPEANARSVADYLAQAATAPVDPTNLPRTRFSQTSEAISDERCVSGVR